MAHRGRMVMPFRNAFRNATLHEHLKKLRGVPLRLQHHGGTDKVDCTDTTTLSNVLTILCGTACSEALASSIEEFARKL